MYMPNIPEATAALLAVAKIGAIVMPLFSGFGADAIVTRLTDSGAIAILTVDGAPRRGKVAGAKSVIDEAAKSVPALKHVIVKRHVAVDHDWVEGRDHWWDELTAAEDGTTPTRAMPADDPFLPASALPQDSELAASVTLELSSHGGHVGFIDGPWPWRARYWLEQRLLQFFNQYLPTH